MGRGKGEAMKGKNGILLLLLAALVLGLMVRAWSMGAV